MPKLQTRQSLADSARAAAKVLAMVEYQDQLYAPVDFETGTPMPTDPERTVWKRQDLRTIRKIANDTQDILFSTEAEFRSFTFMLKQYSVSVPHPELDLLVPVKGQGVRRLLPDGTLARPTGEFVPATLGLVYDPEVDTCEVWQLLCDWLNSEVQAKALLRHLSVGFQPSWTSGKYILLIGNGSNGKSTLLKMLYHLSGDHSVSQVTRQDMATARPPVTQLNGAVMNIVFDGSRKFVSDSANEKTLIVGEPLSLELKFENIPVTVQTNALFLEGLNQEPKLGDHSGGIQRRLERFMFPNEYKKDRNLENRLLKNDRLSALLKLIMENWVTEDHAGEMLESTTESINLQVDQLWANNSLLQYIEALAIDPLELHVLIKQGAMVDPFLASYRMWAEVNGFKAYDDGHLKTLADEIFVTTRKSVRINGKPSTRRVITEWKPVLTAVFATLTEGIEDDVLV